ncbi:MAG: hypothetical protein EAS49_12735, partial [Brucella intermedia]
MNGRVRAGTEAATDQTRPAAKQVSQPWGRKPKRRFAPATIMLYSVLFVSAVYYLLPLYVMVVTSLKGMPEIRLGNIFAPPVEITFEPWVKAWSQACTGLYCEEDFRSLELPVCQRVTI